MNIFDIFIVQPIFNLLVAIYSFMPGGDFGVSLIIFTIIVRMLMWPLIKKQLHQVKAMRKIQPELKKLKAKFKGNKQAEGMAMLEMYKKHGISPFRTLGIALIQLPIFFGIYRVVQIFAQDRDEIGKYAYGFLENLAPIQKIINNPDTFNENLFGVIDLTQRAISENGISIVLILIAIGAAVLQYFMAKQTMPQTGDTKRLRDIMAVAAEGKEPDQADINAAVSRKMIKLLPFMMLFIMLSLPGAIALYYAVSNIVGFIQQSIILKQDEHELEEIADEVTEKTPGTGKKATAKARAKNAQEAKVAKVTDEPKITRITAKDTAKRGK